MELNWIHYHHLQVTPTNSTQVRHNSK
jgi:hypothetical protein